MTITYYSDNYTPISGDNIIPCSYTKNDTSVLASLNIDSLTNNNAITYDCSNDNSNNDTDTNFIKVQEGENFYYKYTGSNINNITHHTYNGSIGELNYTYKYIYIFDVTEVLNSSGSLNKLKINGYYDTIHKSHNFRLSNKHKCIIKNGTFTQDGEYNNKYIIDGISTRDESNHVLLNYIRCNTIGRDIDAYDIISDKNEIVKSKSQLNDSYANNIENNSYNLNKLNHKLSLINSTIKVQQDNYKLKNRATVILIFFIFVIIVGGIVGVVAYSYYYKKQTLKIGDFTNKFNNTFSNAINNSTNFMSNIVINNKNLNNNSNLHNNSNLL
jgi:hypothetical protein